MRDFSECHPLRVREPQPDLDLSFENPVFGNKILITQKELLVHSPGNVGQNARPIHKCPPPPIRINPPIIGLI
jgi:hypothetical protein